MTAQTASRQDRLAPLICGVYGVDETVLVNCLSQYGVHQVLQDNLKKKSANLNIETSLQGPFYLLRPTYQQPEKIPSVSVY